MAILPFIFSGYKKENNKHYLSITPFYWKTKTPKKQFNMLAPIFFHSKKDNDEGKTNSFLVLPIWHYKKTNKTIPIGKDEIAFQKNLSYTLIPIYHQTKIEITRDNKNKQIYNLQAFTPLVWSLKSEDKKFRTYVPFYWHYTEQEPGKRMKFTMVFPLVFSREFHQKWWLNKEAKDSAEYLDKNFTVLPFYHNKLFYSKSYQNKKGWIYKYKNTQMITPLFWRLRDSLQSFTTILPLYIHRTKTSENENNLSTFVLPLYFAKNKSNYNPITQWKVQENKLVWFPIYRKYYYQTYKNNGLNDSQLYTINSLLIFPIYLNNISKSLDYNNHTLAITPLFWKNQNNDEKSTILFPFLYQFKFKKWQSTTLFPFFSVGKSLDSSGHKHLAITPLFWQVTQKHQSTNLLFPLFIHTQYPQSNYCSLNLGLWLFNRVKTDSSVQNYIFWPLIGLKKNPTQKSFHASPIIWYKKSNSFSHKDSAFAERSLLIFPLYLNKFKKSLGSDQKIMALTPLFWNLKSNENRSTLLLPLFYQFKLKEAQSTTLFPLFSFGKSLDSSSKKHLVISPLFWNLKQKEKTTNLLLPFYIHTQNKESNYSRLNLGLWIFNRVKTDTSSQNHILWPLIGFGQTPQQQTLHVSPIIWYKKSKALSYLAIFPLYFQQKTPIYSASYLLGPLYINKKVFGEYKKTMLLAGIYKQTKYENGDYDKRIVHLLYANSKVNGERLRVIFPLYYVKDFNNGNYSKSYALGFYNTMKKKIPNSQNYYKEARVFWFIRYKSNFAYLKSLGINFDRKKLK
jgi:hypothetical protein